MMVKVHTANQKLNIKVNSYVRQKEEKLRSSEYDERNTATLSRRRVTSHTKLLLMSISCGPLSDVSTPEANVCVSV
jgi:hypothetical protein